MNDCATENIARPDPPHVFRPDDGDTLRSGSHPVIHRALENLAAERDAHAATSLALTNALARGEHLEAELLAVQEAERAQFGRDLHDGVCQSLAGVSLRLQCYARQVAGGQSTAAEQAAEARHIDLLLGEAFTEVRALSHRLVPAESVPGPKSFGVALHRLAERTGALLGIECLVRGCPSGLVLEGTVATHLLRVAQEAITNARRHGGAERIVIQLSRRGERGRLTVEDDGVGLPERRSAHAGLGLHTMTYRAAMVGGTLRVRRGGLAGGAGPGTTVRCSFIWQPPTLPPPA